MIKKICIFVDGENFRRSIVKLFEKTFKQADYLPQKAKWDELFDWIAQEVAKTGKFQDCERVRTYWYVIEGIDYYPMGIPDPVFNLEKSKERYLKFGGDGKKFDGLSDDDEKKFLAGIREQIKKNEATMKRRFNGWIDIQNKICETNTAIEFRRAGVPGFNLIKYEFGSEKAVDVMLATDVITLQNIYDIAIIVSGDQDYVPAVNCVKNSGKRVVNVAFEKRNGDLLPGGAKRLRNVTDWMYKIPHNDLKRFLGL